MKNDSIAPEDGEYVQISLDTWRSLHLSLSLSIPLHSGSTNGRFSLLC